jgi:uncharacterized cupredoxin-like copper-binding protein
VPTRPAFAAALVALALVAAACGGSADKDTDSSGAEPRTINVEMRDIAYEPATITVPAGEEVRLVFHNGGRVDHEAFIGDDREQADHAAEMKDGGAMHHGGGAGDAITVEPGKTASLTHTFEEGDEVLIGCHQPGHFAAGMKLTVTTT